MGVLMEKPDRKLLKNLKNLENIQQEDVNLKKILEKLHTAKYNKKYALKNEILMHMGKISQKIV